MDKKTNTKSVLDSCISRRAFLVGSGAAVATTVFLTTIPGLEGKAIAAQVTKYPRMKIGSLRSLKTGKPVEFKYPDNGKNSKSILVKLGTRAGGGIGKGQDVVALNSLCTHMGGGMARTYKAGDYAVGPCPLHQSTFDLTKHGMIISGHATESLPQVLLETEGDDIYAVGMIGLIYGRYDNLKG